MSGHGCPKCASSVSKMETRWLNSLNIPEEYRQKTIKINNRNYKVDAYNPTNNTIYEFYGDYWHGNPKVYHTTDINNHSKKTFGFLYRKTIEREFDLKSKGYHIKSIWQSDFLK